MTAETLRQFVQMFVSMCRKNKLFFLHIFVFWRIKSADNAVFPLYNEDTRQTRDLMKRREHHGKQNPRLHKACRRHLCRRRQGQYLSATHCATRLRLVLRETPSDEVTKQISEMPAVIKVMESGGQYQVVIGTHALISEGVEYKNLGLVITDEQLECGLNILEKAIQTCLK